MKFQFVLEEFCLFTVFIHTYFVLSVHKAKDTYTIPITYQYRYPFIPHTYLSHAYLVLNHPHTCHVPETHLKGTLAFGPATNAHTYLIRTLPLPSVIIINTNNVPLSSLLCACTMQIPFTYLLGT